MDWAESNANGQTASIPPYPQWKQPPTGFQLKLLSEKQWQNATTAARKAPRRSKLLPAGLERVANVADCLPCTVVVMSP